METNSSTPEPKNDEDVTVLALLQKMNARLDGLERQISASPIMSSSDGQAPVQMVLESLPHHPSASGIREVARQGGLLGASRLTLQDLHQGQHVQAGANQFAQCSLHAQAARKHVQQPAQPHQGINDERYQRGIAQFGAAWIAVPDNKTSKLMIQRFTGKELYVVLGSGFREWAFSFLEALEMAEMASGFRWAERVKVNKLGEYLEKDSTASDYFRQNVATWWSISPHLEFVLEEMFKIFKVTVTHEQALILFMKPKEPSRSWSQHLLYLVHLARVSQSSERRIIDNIAKHVAPRNKHMMFIWFDPARLDYVAHAHELITWAQEIEYDQKNAMHMGRDVVASVGESRKSHNRVAIGHPKKDYPTPPTNGGGRDNTTKNKQFALAVVNFDKAAKICAAIDSTDRCNWVMDSGASRHLVGDESLLHDAVACNDEDGLTLPNEAKLHVTKVGKVTFETYVDGEIHEITLSDVYYAPSLSKDLRLISYGRLKKNGCQFVDAADNGGRIEKDGQTIFEFQMVNDVCMVDTIRNDDRLMTKDLQVGMVLSATEETRGLSQPHEGTLMQFHTRLGHLAFESIERIAMDPKSGIKITDHKRSNCVICSQGKGTRTPQPKKDLGQNAPIDRIGGFICSDLKGPITPQDKRGNRYMVTFIDYKSNYVRVFVATHKNKAAAKFRDFVAWFEAEFNCRIRVLRTDGGGEYDTVSVDLFCKQSGIKRQTTEAGTP